MKQYVNADCQIITEFGKVITVQAGDVIEHEDKQAHCTPLDDLDGPIDFTTASEDLLMQAHWTPREAVAAMKEAYGAKLPTSKKSKEDIIQKIMDIRYRALKDSDLNPTT